MKELSIKSLFLLMIGFLSLPLIFPVDSNAQGSNTHIKRGELKPSGKMKVYGQGCNLSVLKKTNKLEVKCKRVPNGKTRPSDLGIVYLYPREVLRVSGRNCTPTFKTVAKDAINIKCLREVHSPTPSATASPVSTSTATSTPTLTHTPTLTSTPTPVADLLFLTASEVTIAVNTSVIFQVQNQSTTVTAFNVQAPLPASWTDVSQTITNVSQNVANCSSLAPGEVCSIVVNSGNTPRAQADVPIKGVNTNTALLKIEIIPVTTMGASVSNLDLAVNDTTLNAALTGTPRIITITNSGVVTAQNLNFIISTLPTGAAITTNCPANLAAGSSCTLTITPGASESAAAGDTNPAPITIEVTSDNSNTLLLTANILTYGSVTQGGFLYSVDDTTPDTGSIGGKVVTLVDQAAANIGSGPQAGSIIWASTGGGGGPGDEDLTTILGIDETSTTTVPSPSSPAYPGGTPAFIACNGSNDGQCNSSNILSYYNFNRAVGGAPPTPLVFYSAGHCAAPINGFSDWYLPAICQLNSIDTSVTCPAGAQSMVGNLSLLLGDPNVATPETSCSAGSGCIAGFYWSSTEFSPAPISEVWSGYMSSGGSSLQISLPKALQLGVRCSRDF